MCNNRVKLMQGNEACVEGALYAGMRFYGGYPITPSTEVAELSSKRLPLVGGKFIQMEDELGGIAAAIGASLAGLKSMTATSGPGFSLKQENLGYACISEIPLVIVNVQRGGPSTGLPTSPSQADYMQTRWGTHGDHSIIVVSPSSVYETFTETVRAFNLAEKYRTPVILLTDEIVGHMREKVVLPADGELEVIERKMPEVSPADYKPYDLNYDGIVAPLAPFGSGYRYHVTGLFHDETGFPSNSIVNAQKMIEHMAGKINNNLDDILKNEIDVDDDMEVLFVAFGSTARACKGAVNALRERGKKVGLFRPITVWPFPEQALFEVSQKTKHIIVAELNLGQMLLEVERTVKDNAEIHFLGKANGDVILPRELVAKALEVLGE